MNKRYVTQSENGSAGLIEVHSDRVEVVPVRGEQVEIDVSDKDWKRLQTSSLDFAKVKKKYGVSREQES
jgi:hypothetical protein